MSQVVYALAGVLVGFGLTLLKDLFFGRSQRRRSARYLAIRVVCELDKFVETCRALIDDDGLCHGLPDKDGCHAPQVAAPSTIEYPSGLDWQSIDPKLMYALLSLPNKIRSANVDIELTWEYASPPDYAEYFVDRGLHYARLGQSAHGWSAHLRALYGIPANELRFDPEVKFRQAIETFERKRNAADTALNALIASHSKAETE